MALRTEIIVDDPLYLFWIGEGTKSLTNKGIFSVGVDGTAYFGGSINPSITYASVQNSMLKNNPAVYTGQVPTAGNKKNIICSLIYTNSGTRTGNLTGTLQGTAKLEKSYNGQAWTTVSQWPWRASYSSTLVSGTTYNVNININMSRTVQDTSTQTGQNRYRLSITNTGTLTGWPLQLSSQWGIQRLSLNVTEV